MTHTTVSTETPDRPLCVWILTIFAFIFVGVLPFVNSLGALLTGHFSEQPIIILITLPVCLGAAITSVGAWQGRLGGKRHLLNFVTIYYVTIAIGHAILLLSGKLAENQLPGAYTMIIRGIIFPLVYLYYFNLPSTNKFYEASDRVNVKSRKDTQIGSGSVQTGGPYHLIGVYPIHPTTESIIAAARYHNYDFCIDEDGNFTDPIYPETFENLCLVELMISGDFSPELLMSITQKRHDQKPGEGQAPYMEFYLNGEGTTLIPDKQAQTVSARRVCFFLHLVDPSLPLSIGKAALPLPPITELPARLQPYTHYVPVD